MECCSKPYCNDNKCSLHKNTVNTKDCITQLATNALDLINRLKAENENLKDILYDAEGVNLVNYWHQQCKIAENGNRNFDEENKKLKAEIERLKDEYKECLKRNCDLMEALMSYKSEAHKEFDERLKEDCLSYPLEKDDITMLVDVKNYNNLLKELVGEDNA